METQKDEQLQTVERFITKGWPEYAKGVPNSVQIFYKWKVLYLWKECMAHLNKNDTCSGLV